MSKFEIILSNIIITITIVAAFFYLTKNDYINTNEFSEIAAMRDTIYFNNSDQINVNKQINNSRNTIITNTVKNVSPAVVGISIKEIRQYQYNSPFNNHPFWGRFFGNQVFNKEISGLGSGVIISSDGYI